MNLKLKLTQWTMDEPSNRATLYIKDVDDNPTKDEINMQRNPIDEIVCTDGDLNERHFFQVNVIEELTSVMDGDFLTHPLIIHYETYSS